MRQIRALRIAAVAAGIALMATGCGATGKSSTGSESSGAAAGPITGLQIMVPNTPGGGYDTTARAAAKVLDDEKISTNTEVFNLAGAGGTVGLARVVNEKGNGDLTMLDGPGRGGRQLHQQVRVEADRDHPAGPPDRRARRHHGQQGFAVQDHR